ncbi:unnamed protein product, partial [Darwinula stevensoni]
MIPIPTMKVLSGIFEYLDWEDILAVRVVSRQWKEVGDFHFRERGKVVCDAPPDFDITGILKMLSSWSVVPRSLVFKNVALEGSGSDDGKQVLEDTRELALLSCSVHPDALVRLLTSSPRLSRLCIHDPCVAFLCLPLRLHPGSLPSVQCLDLSSTRRLDDSLLTVFWRACPNLVQFSLSASNLASNPAIFRRFYPRGSEEPTNNVLTMRHLERLVCSKEKFHSLSLTHMNLNSSSLCNILCKTSILLGFLDLSGCRELSSQCLVEIIERQKSLHGLRLAGTSGVSDPVLSRICTHLPFLRDLSMGDGSVSFSKGVLEGLHGLQDLNNLKISCHGDFRLVGLKQLRCLSLEYCYLRPNPCDEQTCQPQQLRELYLERCSTITDLDMQVLLGTLKNLVVLRLRDLPLTDFAFSRMVNSAGIVLSGLTPEMKERGFWEVSTKSETERRLVREIKAKEASEELLVSTCGGADPPLRKLQHLRELAMIGMKNITDVTVISGIQDQALQHLNLSYSPLISNLSMVHLSGLPEVASLRSLNVSGCTQISDDGLARLLHRTPHLREFSFRECTGVTRATLKCLEKHCPLTHLISVNRDQVISFPFVRFEVNHSSPLHLLSSSVPLSTADKVMHEE